MLTVRQAEVLQFIIAHQWANDNETPGLRRVGNAFGVGQGAIANIVSELEARGFVRRLAATGKRGLRPIQVIKPVPASTLNGEPLFAVPFHHAQPISIGLDK